MVDGASVESRLQRLGELLTELDEIRAVAGHLLAAEQAAVPEDYASLFTALVPAGLDQELARRLVRATGLRNVLVHGYLDLDEDVLWDALDHLDDLRGFAAYAEGRVG